jgi:hypothetical protein
MVEPTSARGAEADFPCRAEAALAAKAGFVPVISVVLLMGFGD